MKAPRRRLASTLTAILLSAGFSGTASASYIGASWSRQVPEPGTLALFAICLIGIGMGVALSRRRSQKK